jgi:hypothetical protein
MLRKGYAKHSKIKKKEDMQLLNTSKLVSNKTKKNGKQ